MWWRTLVGAAAAVGVAAHGGVAQGAGTVTTRSSDGLTVHGETYFGSLPATAPLILLFHQGGSNGRGEYEDIAHWLNSVGYRAMGLGPAVWR